MRELASHLVTMVSALPMRQSVIPVLAAVVVFPISLRLMWPRLRPFGVRNWADCILPSVLMATVVALFVKWALL